jgi:hypothetical protein
MTGINKEYIRTNRNNDGHYFDIGFYVSESLFMNLFEDFRKSYYQISNKYGILISYLNSPYDEYKSNIKYLDSQLLYRSMFYNVNLINDFPCYLFGIDNNQKLKANYYHGESLIQTMHMKYLIRFIIKGFSFFPYYQLFGTNEVIDNSRMYYLNTTRYNSYFREIRRMFQTFGFTEYLFDSLTYEISNTESINNK